ILYDSGNAKLRPEAYMALDKVAEVLKGGVPDSNIGIEGHTDDQPIKYSSWKSNWELSAARALGVLHYLIDKGGIVPARLSVSAFGEYQPVAPNGTKEGSQLNRRVEIVILPVLNKERKEIPQDADNKLPEQPAENLK
ncbi:MAG: OmpA family protein, partial [Candidatus Omnitrophica bacterium]|nr:OmpA family protein [Candidatus Omnitrophota bacterium]